jgi:hypothetical protein
VGSAELDEITPIIPARPSAPQGPSELRRREVGAGRHKAITVLWVAGQQLSLEWRGTPSVAELEEQLRGLVKLPASEVRPLLYCTGGNATHRSLSAQ